ncbi:SCO family protein [Maribacter sp.]|uniref:SCO family protein n=1 Tax=Maribacter sp. TaxID=1897614 RepID=UPI0025C58639|nr:SCO family protein [Maribacter sp.]
MRNIQYILIFIGILLLQFSCRDGAAKNNGVAIFECPMHCEGDITYNEPGNCKICKMDLMEVAKSVRKVEADYISEESIFNLTTKWVTEENRTIELKDLKGKTLVMVMIYTTCKAACPRLVADMRNIEKQLPQENRKNMHFVLVSIDPETDTPEHLKAFALENQMDEEHWTFLQGTKDGVREFANVLAMKYKQISPIDFSHSNIISVLNAKGELIHQQEGLGVDNKETILKIKELIR